MPRPTEFDRDRALNAALKLFCRQGYTATSMSQLLNAMKLSRSSLYAAFGDKRSLFAETLTLFGDRTRQMLLESADPQDPIASVRAFFDKTTFDVPAWRASAGCMMVNTILELADVDAELNQLAAAKLGEIEAEFANLFRRVSDKPEQLAALVMTLNKGIRVSSRAGDSPQQLDTVITSTLALLEQAA